MNSDTCSSRFNKRRTLTEISRLISEIQASLLSAVTHLADEDTRAMEQYAMNQRHSEGARRSIECLPDEVLITIITLVLDTQSFIHYQNEFLLPLSKLSRRFCSLVYGTPAFWTRVRMTRGIDEVQRSLTLSKNAGLNVEIMSTTRFNAAFQACLSRVADHYQRWKALDLMMLNEETWMYLKELVDGSSFPSVTSLKLHNGLLWEPTKTLEERYFPLLESLSLHFCDFPVKGLSSLTHLVVVQPSKLINLVRFLRETPSLKVLRLSGSTARAVDPDILWSMAEAEVVDLRYLKQLFISFTVDGEIDPGEKEDEAEAMMMSAVSWLMRCLKAQALSLFHIEVRTWSIPPQQGAHDNFFPHDVDLRHVEDLSLSLSYMTDDESDYRSIRCIDTEDYRRSNPICEKAVPALLERCPSVKNLKMKLPYFSPLLSDIRHCPSLQSLTLECSKPLDASDLITLTTRLRGGGHESTSLYLKTTDASPCRSNDITIRMEEWLGGTFFTWEDSVQRLAIYDDGSIGNPSDDDDESTESGEFSSS